MPLADPVKKAIALLAVLLLLLAGWVNTPPSLSPDAAPPAIDGDLETRLAQANADAARTFGLVPGTEKRIRW